MLNKFYFFLVIFGITNYQTINASTLDKCLFISSYHEGYEWSDGVEEGLRKTLTPYCEIKQFNMDTKRNKSLEFKENQALKAKEIIENYKPNVVITADDNAAKYIIKKYYKNSKTPFVFCGVNWTVKEYGFPYENVTGMVEIAPIKDILKYGIKYSKGKKVLYLGANTLTEEKNFYRYAQFAKKYNFKITKKLTNNTKEWQDIYKLAQDEYDFILVGSNSGINDWNKKTLTNFVKENTKIITLTVHGWMMPYSILGLTKIPQEQGEWAGMSAIEIIKGTKPNEIPIVTNRLWDIWINDTNLLVSKIKLDKSLIKKAKKY